MDGDIKKRLELIESSISCLGANVLSHMESDKSDHLAFREELVSLNRKQEKIEDKIDSFFAAVSDLKEEMYKTNTNMTIYNNSLIEHMRRTIIAEERLDKLEDISISIKEKQVAHDHNIEKIKLIASTITKVLVSIAGLIGFTWTVIQMIGKLK